MPTKPKIINRVPAGRHVYDPEWGDGSPCSWCMASKDAHQYVRQDFIVDLFPKPKKRSTIRTSHAQD